MTDYKRQYKDETGKDARNTGTDGVHLHGPMITVYTDDFVDWLIQTADRLKEEKEMYERILFKAEAERDALIQSIKSCELIENNKVSQFYTFKASHEFIDCIDRIRGKE